MCDKQSAFFLLGPIALADPRVQLVVPPLPALLASPPVQQRADEVPSLRAVLFNQFADLRILGNIIKIGTY